MATSVTSVIAVIGGMTDFTDTTDRTGHRGSYHASAPVDPVALCGTAAPNDRTAAPADRTAAIARRPVAILRAQCTESAHRTLESAVFLGFYAIDQRFANPMAAVFAAETVVRDALAATPFQRRTIPGALS